MSTDGSQGANNPPNEPQPQPSLKSTPGLNDVFAKLKATSSPLDFAKENSKKAQTVQGTVVTDPRNEPPKETQVEPSAEPTVTKPDFSLNFDFDDVPLEVKEPEPTEGEPSPQETATEEKPEETVVTDDEETSGPVKSIGALRRKFNETKGRLQELQTELETKDRELERYRSGEHEPEKIKEYESRISELSKFEKLHNLKFSKEYKQEYIEPLESLKEKARTLAEEYGTDPSVFDQALRIDNKKDLHAFLHKHFDDVGVLEARETIQSIKDLATRITQAEAEPAQELERLQTQAQEREQREYQQKLDSIAQTTREGWSSALDDVRTAGKYPELTLRDNDHEHNQIAKPILDEAAKEFGNTVKFLVKAGAKDLPAPFLKMLAKRFALSQASAVIAKSREYHHQMSEQIQSTARKRNGMVRPPLGATTNGHVVAPQQSKPKSLEEAAQRHMDAILKKGK